MPADFTSPYYPFEKVQSGYLTMEGSQKIPLRLLRYLLDLPDASGYRPKDDNRLPRVRLAKYLWHDGPNPLGEPLPDEQQKTSMLFDGETPVLNTDRSKAAHPKGYRLYPLEYWGQSELEAKTVLKCYLGRIVWTNPFRASIGVYFSLICNVDQENTTRTEAYSRSYNMEQCIVEALHGVNIGGVGVCDCSRLAHANNGSEDIWDRGTHVGRLLHMSVDWMEGEERP